MMARHQSLPDCSPFSSRWTSLFLPLLPKIWTDKNPGATWRPSLYMTCWSTARTFTESCVNSPSETYPTVTTPVSRAPHRQRRSLKVNTHLVLSSPRASFYFYAIISFQFGCDVVIIIPTSGWKRITHACARSPELRTSLHCAQSQLLGEKLRESLEQN